MTAAIHALFSVAAVSTAMLCAGCEKVRDPPPRVVFGGLPVSGRLGDAQRAGFTTCVDLDAVHIRCRRDGVVLAGAGPYAASVDLDGSDGSGGFDHLTLWNDTDNDAVFRIAAALEQAGWSKCFTGNGRAGDQAIYTRAGSPVRVSMDISYWSKRRLRVIPESDRREGRCAAPGSDQPRSGR